MDMPHAKGGFVGLADHHTRIHMYRAIIEGINYSLMEGIKLAENAGKFKVTELRLGGGGSQSSEICQITANMFGIPVVRIHTHDATALGSAIAAFVAMGEFENFDAASAAMVHERDRFEPDMKEHKLYSALYEEVYKEIFGKLNPLYGKVQDIYARFH
jgi:sugar (pentulose or hexulose) kinase